MGVFFLFFFDGAKEGAVRRALEARRVTCTRSRLHVTFPPPLRRGFAISAKYEIPRVKRVLSNVRVDSRSCKYIRVRTSRGDGHDASLATGSVVARCCCAASRELLQSLPHADGGPQANG